MKCPVEQFLNRAKFDRWSKYFPASRTAFNSAFEMWFFSSNNVYIGAPSVVTERSLVEGLLEQWMVEQTGHDIIWPKNIGFRKYSKCSVWNINIQFCSILERVSESGALESEKTLFENLFGARKAIKWESFWPGPHWSSWWWFVSSLPISYYTTTDLTSEEEEDDKGLRQELKNIKTGTTINAILYFTWHSGLVGGDPNLARNWAEF